MIFTTPSTTPRLPEAIIVRPIKREEAVYVCEGDRILGDADVAARFGQIDEEYSANSLAYFKRIREGVSTLDLPGGRLDYAFLYDGMSIVAKDIAVVMSPLNDGPPKSPPGVVNDYARSKQSLLTREYAHSRAACKSTA